MVTQSVAQSRAPACGRISNIVTQTGNIANADDGINTRFDLYPNGPFQHCNNNSLYGPASNVRKGYLQQGGNACNQNPVYSKNDANNRELLGGDYTARGFPLDSNQITSSGIPDTSAVAGNGTWKCADTNLTTTNTTPINSTGGETTDKLLTLYFYRWHLSGDGSSGGRHPDWHQCQQHPQRHSGDAYTGDHSAAIWSLSWCNSRYYVPRLLEHRPPWKYQQSHQWPEIVAAVIM